jgi:hypothetical protein
MFREDAGPLISGPKKGYLMIDDSSRRSWDARNAVMAIGVGGLIAGTLDIATSPHFIRKECPIGDFCWSAKQASMSSGRSGHEEGEKDRYFREEDPDAFLWNWHLKIGEVE